MIRFTKYDDGFNSIRFVLRARETKDKTKPSFMGIYSDGVNIVCSDSRRLNLAPVKIKAGLYEVIKDSSTEVILGEQIDGQFPDYTQVIPKLDAPIKISNWIKLYNFGASKAFYQLAVAGVCVNYSYLDDAIRDAENPLAHITGEKSPVVITHDLGTAVIMPYIIKEEDK